MARVAALAVLAAALFTPPSAAAAELAADKAAAIEAAIDKAARAQGIPGLTAAVVQDDVVWTRGFGEADVENHVPAKPETVYRLASVSKPITAVAVMQLVERRKIDLDADVRSYVPAFPRKQWPVTTRELLAHLGGIRHYQGDEWDSTRHYASLLEGLDVFKDDPLVHEPGTAYLYSTHGYTLLGAVVEAASGRAFVEYLRENVLRPAGMERTRDDDARAIIENRAQGYVKSPDGRLQNSDLADTSYKIPGGGLVATAGDLARFGAALLDGRLLRPETRAAMWTEQHTKDGRGVAYGLGWDLAGQPPREAWHTGAQQRVSTILYLRPQTGTVVVLMANLEGVSHRLELAQQIADLVQR